MSLSKRPVYGILAITFASLGILFLVLVFSFSKRAESNGKLVETGNPQVVARGFIDVSRPWTSAGTFKGRIVVIVDGKAILHFGEGPVGPEGNGKSADDTFPLPGQSAFCALAKFGDHVEKVGAYRELFLDSATELFLGPNDEFGQQHGPGFSDNNGSWSYRILSLDEIKAKKETRTITFVVKATEKWRDTGIHVDKGQEVAISASGMVTWAPVERVGSNVVGPDGTRPPYPQDALGFPMPHAGIGSLVMRIGERKYAVGSREKIEALESGTIELMVNDDVVGDNSGNFTVNIEVR